MWKNVNVNKNQIEIDTGKSVLINCPHNSNYDGYSFWHTSKLVRAGRHSASVSIGYTDDFKFALKKYGKGKYNKSEVLDEVEIDVEELLRLKQISGLASLFKDKDFSKSWE